MGSGIVLAPNGKEVSSELDTSVRYRKSALLPAQLRRGFSATIPFPPAPAAYLDTQPIRVVLILQPETTLGGRRRSMQFPHYKTDMSAMASAPAPRRGTPGAPRTGGRSHRRRVGSPHRAGRRSAVSDFISGPRAPVVVSVALGLPHRVRASPDAAGVHYARAGRRTARAKCAGARKGRGTVFLSVRPETESSANRLRQRRVQRPFPLMSPPVRGARIPHFETDCATLSPTREF